MHGGLLLLHAHCLAWVLSGRGQCDVGEVLVLFSECSSHIVVVLHPICFQYSKQFCFTIACVPEFIYIQLVYQYISSLYICDAV